MIIKHLVGAVCLSISISSFAQIWVDSAGTAVQDGAGSATNRTGRGVVSAGTGSVGFNIDDIIVLPPAVASAIRDLSEYFNGQDTINAVCVLPELPLSVYHCPGDAVGSPTACASSQAAEWVDIGVKNSTHNDVFEYETTIGGILRYKTGGDNQEFWRAVGDHIIQKGKSVSSNFLAYKTQVTPSGNGWIKPGPGLQVPAPTTLTFPKNAFRVVLNKKSGYSFDMARSSNSSGVEWDWVNGDENISVLESETGIFKACCLGVLSGPSNSLKNIINYPVFKTPTIGLYDPHGVYDTNFLNYKYIYIAGPTGPYTNSTVKTAYFAKHGVGSIGTSEYAVRKITHPLIGGTYQPYVDIDIDRAVFIDASSGLYGAYTTDSHTTLGELFKFNMLSTLGIGGGASPLCSNYGCQFEQHFPYFGPLSVSTADVQASPSATTFPFRSVMRCNFTKN